MVDVSNKHKSITVAVSSKNGNTVVAASSDTAQYWANQSHTFANQAKESVQEAKEYAELANSYIEGFEDVVSKNTDSIISTGNDYINQITGAADAGIADINSTKTTILSDIEFVADGEKQEIQSLVDDEKEEIKDLANLIKENAQDIASRTSFAMFDTVLKDHVLTYEESKGLALQGTYVYKEAVAGSRYGYADFYNKCLEEKEAGIATEVTLGETTITMYVNSNGHQFYDITDKEAVDIWFETYGFAWFYGIDTENECVFLPRNNWFEQATGVESEAGLGVEAGLPNITGYLGDLYSWGTGVVPTGAFAGSLQQTASLTVSGSAVKFGNARFNASKSNPIYGNSDTVQPNAVKKLLYICVGNTVADTSWVDVVTQVEEGVKDIEEAKDEAIDELKNITGGTVPLGFIGFSALGIDETLGLQRCLNGQIIIQDQFKGFTKFLKRRIELYPSLACTEEEWQTAVIMSTNGVCEKFVIDDEAGTIRLPKYPEYFDIGIDGAKTVDVFGTGKTLGLTNGEQNIGLITYSAGVIGGMTGCYNKNYGTGTGGDWNRNQKAFGVVKNASQSGLTGSVDVESEKIKGTYFIQVATGAEVEDNIVNEIELNNPYSLLDVKWSDKLLNNISWLRSEGQANSKAIYNDVYELILREYNSGTDETETVGGVSITFRRGVETNIKVTTDKSAYDSILSATGTAWYYVIDTANEMFYLPQSDGFLQFGGSGNFVEAGLPNIEGRADFGTGSTSGGFGGIRTGQSVGAFYSDASGYTNLASATGTSSWSRYLNIDASLSNSIYGNSDTVQPNAVTGYLYFYVGETVQNVNLINAGRIEETLVTKTNKVQAAAASMPSDRYIDLTLGASGTEYSAPANGWFSAHVLSTNAGQGLFLSNVEAIYLHNGLISTTTGQPLYAMMPVQKGQKAHLNYQGNLQYIRFIYAEGDK